MTKAVRERSNIRSPINKHLERESICEDCDRRLKHRRSERGMLFVCVQFSRMFSNCTTDRQAKMFQQCVSTSNYTNYVPGEREDDLGIEVGDRHQVGNGNIEACTEQINKFVVVVPITAPLTTVIDRRATVVRNVKDVQTNR